MTDHFENVEDCVERLLTKVGRRLVVGTPLGLGKANLLLNELYRRAAEDASISLTINTALTLEPPTGSSELERRFLEPLVERLYAGYPRLKYAEARAAGTLPDNIRVHEFFLTPGRLLANPNAQQYYISSNYTHVARDMVNRGANVVVQMVSPGIGEHRGRVSLSCNPDVTLELVRRMRARPYETAVVGEINTQLPFMYGDAEVGEDYFDALFHAGESGYTLFGTPKTAVSNADFMVGLYASTLIKDGGTLQVGIGSLGDATIYALGQRQERNSIYRTLLEQSGCDAFDDVIAKTGGFGDFEDGLYGATEMLVDGFLYLYDKGILKRKVYDDIPIQSLLKSGRIGEQIMPETLNRLREVGAISNPLTSQDVTYLKKFGVLRSDVDFVDGALRCADGSEIEADLDNADTHQRINEKALGVALSGGVIAHGGFYLGPTSFYQALHAMPEVERRAINMTSVQRINQLQGSEELDVLQRTEARFINSCLMVTANGAVVSDGLADGRVVSGVGGQYNFVAMAHALAGGRSIITLRSTRTSNGSTNSNIVWSYGNVTIPRHLRDVVVTEYGIADLRGKSDAECIEALLNISDSRFQSALLRKAVSAGKLPKSTRIADRFRNNTPARISELLKAPRSEGLFGKFPFGTDLTDDEIVLGGALRRLKEMTAGPIGMTRSVVAAIISKNTGTDTQRLLARLGLEHPGSLKERLYARLVSAALAR